MTIPVSVLKERAQTIRLLAFDVDGVLTDGGIFLSEATEFLRFDVQDGSAMSIARRAGYHLALITGRRSPAAIRRAEMLGITDMLTSIVDKRTALMQLAEAKQLPPEAVLFMGDDLLDLPAFSAAHLRVAPANAVPEVRSAADWITQASGGHGAVREAIELVMRTQGTWEPAVADTIGKHLIGQ